MVIRLAYAIDSDNSRKFRKYIMNRLMGIPMYENVCGRSRGDRYLSHRSRHTQVPVPATTKGLDELLRICVDDKETRNPKRKNYLKRLIDRIWGRENPCGSHSPDTTDLEKSDHNY